MRPTQQADTLRRGKSTPPRERRELKRARLSPPPPALLVTRAGYKRAASMVPRILRLPPQQLKQLRAWLAAGDTYASVRQRLKKRFGVSVGVATISRFYTQDGPPPELSPVQPGAAFDAIIGNIRIKVFAPRGAPISIAGWKRTKGARA